MTASQVLEILNSPFTFAPDDLPIGETILAENEPLFLANSQGFAPSILTYAQFLERFQKTYKKPNKPTILEGISSTLPRLTKQAVKQIWLEEKARKQYQQALQTYDEQVRAQSTLIHRYTPDIQGYIQYLVFSLPQLEESFFLLPKRLPISEKTRRRHTYIVGQSGCGKSELIKQILYHYLTRNTSTGLVVIDPHSDLAKEIAQFKINVSSDRLVYINPTLSSAHTPVINPFHLFNSFQNGKNTNLLNKAANEFVEVLQEVFKKQELTPSMITLLKAVVTVLLMKKDSDFYDLLAFMDETTCEPYLSFARAHIRNQAMLHLFTHEFLSDRYQPTREAIRSRLLHLLQNDTLHHFLCGKQTIELKTLINQRKLIIFDLGGLDHHERTLVSRFLLAQMKIIALSRSTIPKEARIPCHLFIDECHLALTDSIKTGLQEFRKFKFYLTLAQQFVGDGMSPELKKAVLSNTAIKITGTNSDQSFRAIAAETGATLEQLQTLRPHKFFVHSGARTDPSILVSIATKTLGNRWAMTEPQWNTTLQNQIKKHYRPIQDPKTYQQENNNQPTPTFPAKQGRKPKFDL